jgi:hypothetical protein
MPQRLKGSVLVNGKSHQVLIDGNPFGRTVIQVDGVTVYDKKPTIVQKAIDFDLAPGKKASLKWHQSTGLNTDCVVFDGVTTQLARLPDTVDKAQQMAHLRITGGALLAFSAFSFFLNYISLRDDGTYYWNALAITPCLAASGVASFFHPRVNLSPRSRAGKAAIVIGVIGLLAFGSTLFIDWFLATFSKQ